MAQAPAASLHALDELDALIASRSILDHPFYRAWSAGTLTRQHLATYASTYYPHVAAFPGHLERAAAASRDAAIRAALLDNLREENEVPAPHPELWRRFGAAMGAAIAVEPQTHGPGAATATAFADICSTSTASALAALYAYESQQPEVSRRKAEGLCAHYGIEPANTDALTYFTVHAEADVRHREGERRALARALENGATREEILTAADRALDAYHGLLDGVCERAGIEAC